MFHYPSLWQKSKMPVHIQTNWWPYAIQLPDKLFGFKHILFTTAYEWETLFEGQLIANFGSRSACDIIFDMFQIFKRDMIELL